MQVNDEFLLLGESPQHNDITHQLLGALTYSWLVVHVDQC